MHRIVLLAALAACAAEVRDPAATGAGGAGGDPGEGGAGGSDPTCGASLKVGTGEHAYQAVAPGEEVEVFLVDAAPGTGAQGAPGHLWTSLLVRGLDPDAPIFVQMELSLEDGTPYATSRACHYPLSIIATHEAGWWSLPGLRATFPDRTCPRVDLAGRGLRLKVTVDDGARMQGACTRIEPRCSVTAGLEVTPRIPARNPQAPRNPDCPEDG